MGGGSRSRSSVSTSYHYEYRPDDVRIAEINAQKELMKSKMEQENVKMRSEAAKEIIELNARMQMMVMDAKAAGFERVSQALLGLNREYNIVAETRFRLLEGATLDAVKDINGYYSEIIGQINSDGQRYMEEDLPRLLDKLEQIPESDSSRAIYQNAIEQNITSYVQSKETWLREINSQQGKMVDNSLKVKEELNQQISATVENRMKLLEQSIQTMENENTFARKLLEQNGNLAENVKMLNSGE